MGEVQALLDIQAAEIVALEQSTLSAMLPVLRDARRELQQGLAEWLRSHPDGAERFTAQQLRVSLAAVERTLATIKASRPGLLAGFERAGELAGDLAGRHLITEIARFSQVFEGTARRVQLNTAAVVDHGRELLIPRYRTSAARYVGAVREDIRHQLALGLVNNETFDQLTRRLVKNGGPRGLVALQGVAGEPGARVEQIAEGLFRRYRHWAERLVRTEVVNAYAVQHDDGLFQLNQEREPGQEPYLRRWDASADRRLCPICKALDGTLAAIDGEWPGGLLRPPAHPQCRCVAVAWTESWRNFKGDVPDIVETPVKPKSAKPRTKPAPKAPPAAGDVLAKQLAGNHWGKAHAAITADLESDGLQAMADERPMRGTVVIEKLRPGIGGLNKSDGTIEISPWAADQARDLGKAWAHDPADVRARFDKLGAALERGQSGVEDRLRQQVGGVQVLVHEVLHDFSPLARKAYRGSAVVVEEVTTEILARQWTRDRYGVPWSLLRREGGYQPWMEAMVDGVRDTYSLPTVEKAWQMVVDAARDFKRSKATFITPESAVEAFSHLFPVPKDQRRSRAFMDSNGTPRAQAQYQIEALIHAIGKIAP